MKTNKWRKIDDLFFIYPYKNTDFLIQTYPFKVFKLAVNADLKTIKAFIAKQKKQIPSMIEPGKYYLPLLIGTTACNFKCKYCFAYQGSYGEKPQMMSTNVIKQTVKFLEKTMNKLKRETEKKEIEIGVVFFGGEPLLHLNGLKILADNIRTTVNKVNQKSRVKFKPLVIINTNGSQFTLETLKYLSENKDLFEVVVSFDGIHHDENRILRNGLPTSKIVIAGIKKLAKSGVHFSITSCILPKEVKYIRKNIKYITGLFGKETEINLAFIRGAIKAVKAKAIYPGRLQSLYTDKSLEKYGEDVAKLIREGYKIYERKFINRINEGGYLWRCPASLFEFCVNVDGNVYPCHNFIDDKFKLGNIEDKNFNPLAKQSIIKKFKNRTIYQLPCKDCVFQTVCLSSFDCPSHSYYDLGDMYKVDSRTCIAAQKIMEALLEKSLLDTKIN